MITYWVFGVLANLVFFAITKLVVNTNLLAIATHKYGIYAHRGFIWTYIAYAIFSLICIWRASSKYRGEKIWALFAKLIVILNIIVLIYLFSQKDTEMVFNKSIEMANENLPAMISERTRIDRVYLLKRNIIFDYTLVNVSADDIDINQFNKETRKSLIEKNCVNQSTVKNMKAGRQIYFVYHDRNGNKFSELSISIDDCK